MELKDLEIYVLSRKLSAKAWGIYEKMNWQDKKIIADQWVTSIDSVGANIAEGFGRFHYLDKNKFNYNARGSLLEAIHWTELLEERKKIDSDELKAFLSIIEELYPKLNKYINSTRLLAKK